MSNATPLSRVLLQTLSMLLRALIGAADWGRVRDVVVRLLDTDLPGAAKRDLAVAALRDAGVTLRGAVLNLAIEAAVVWATHPNGKGGPAT
ncbi:MAG TPA: hypothetical protein P5330_03205 [Candidatus Competibacteraceae bacterium]|nr:hypothetical protein [Candidatus Competibacteraceae bacterium]